MSDRTWNHIDARLYEEDWSEEAIIIAACMIARCPNQYGVFDTPMGFLTKFFKTFFAREQIELVLTELEAAGFLKFYNDNQVIWIVSKWKRSGRPSALHWKGLENHLDSYKEVARDFLSYYKAHWKGIESPSHPPLNPDSDTDTDSEEKIKDICPAKTAGRAKKQKKNKPREKKTESQIWYEFFLVEFESRKGHAPVLTKGDVINIHKQYKTCAKIHDGRTIRGVTKYYLSLKDEVWAGHKPHVMFNNFDRLLEGMMEHQKKRTAQVDRGGKTASQIAWEKEQAELQNNPDEIPDKYKLPEATDENNL